MIVFLALLLFVVVELADARPEYRVVLFVAFLALAFLRWVFRRPSARVEAKRREMRRAFRRSLLNRDNFR